MKYPYKDAYGSRHWKVNEKYHRIDGPAFEAHDGGAHWNIDGKLHREDGPAIMFSYGSDLWYLNDWLLDTEEVVGWMKATGIKKYPLTKEESMLFVLRFGK